MDLQLIEWAGSLDRTCRLSFTGGKHPHLQVRLVALHRVQSLHDCVLFAQWTQRPFGSAKRIHDHEHCWHHLAPIAQSPEPLSLPALPIRQQRFLQAALRRSRISRCTVRLNGAADKIAETEERKCQRFSLDGEDGEFKIPQPSAFRSRVPMHMPGVQRPPDRAQGPDQRMALRTRAARLMLITVGARNFLRKMAAEVLAGRRPVEPA